MLFAGEANENVHHTEAKTEPDQDTKETLEILTDVNTKLYIGTEVDLYQSKSLSLYNRVWLSGLKILEKRNIFVYLQDGEIVYTDWTQPKEESDQGECPNVLHCYTFVQS